MIVRKGLDITTSDTGAAIKTYAYADASADFYAEPTEGGHFNLHYPGGVIEDCVVEYREWSGSFGHCAYIRN